MPISLIISYVFNYVLVCCTSSCILCVFLLYITRDICKWWCVLLSSHTYLSPCNCLYLFYDQINDDDDDDDDDRLRSRDVTLWEQEHKTKDMGQSNAHAGVKRRCISNISWTASHYTISCILTKTNLTSLLRITFMNISFSSYNV